MKKFMALVLVLGMVVYLCGCSKGSGVTIDNVKAAFATKDLEIEGIKTEEREGGFIVTGQSSSWDVDIEIICQTDKNSNINQIKIINSNIDVSVYDSEQGVRDIYSTVSTFTNKTLLGAWSIMGPLCCENEIEALASICGMANVESISAMIRAEDIENENWKITIEKNKNENKIVIEAFYLK